MTDGELSLFRHRLDPYIEHGWKIDRDDGDRVDLTVRDYGSTGIHVALAMFIVTFGWGNLLYALYSLLVRSNTITVRASDDLRAWPDVDPRPSGGPLRWALGTGTALVTLAFLPVVIENPASLASWLMFTAMIIATGSLLPPISRRVRDRGSITEFGWTQSTEERVVHTSVQCTVCESIVVVAVERTFKTYYAVAGVPVLTTDSGQNHYCERCCKTAITTDLDRELRRIRSVSSE